jgi:hypothetical protein
MIVSQPDPQLNSQKRIKCKVYVCARSYKFSEFAVAAQYFSANIIASFRDRGLDNEINEDTRLHALFLIPRLKLNT